MIENSLNSIRGIVIYPILSLVLFVAFFVVLIVWVSKTDKKHLADMSILPLDSNNENELNSNGKYYEK